LKSEDIASLQIEGFPAIARSHPPMTTWSQTLATAAQPDYLIRQIAVLERPRDSKTPTPPGTRRAAIAPIADRDGCLPDRAFRQV
jgi:hypothetical protein